MAPVPVFLAPNTSFPAAVKGTGERCAAREGGIDRGVACRAPSDATSARRADLGVWVRGAGRGTGAWVVAGGGEAVERRGGGEGRRAAMALRVARMSAAAAIAAACIAALAASTSAPTPTPAALPIAVADEGAPAAEWVFSLEAMLETPSAT